jgi:hypothetical protein
MNDKEKGYPNVLGDLQHLRLKENYVARRRTPLTKWVEVCCPRKQLNSVRNGKMPILNASSFRANSAKAQRTLYGKKRFEIEITRRMRA